MPDFDPFLDVGPSRVTRRTSAVPRTGVRAQPATLERIPREETEVGETQEQLGYRAAYLVGNARRAGEWGGYYGNKSLTVADLTATLVERTEDSRGEPNGYDGAYEQGSEGETNIILKVRTTDGREVYLRKTGYTDSYGEHTDWSGPWKIVTPKPITKIVYE